MTDDAAHIKVVCEACGARMIAPASAAGKGAQCLKCGSPLLILSAQAPGRSSAGAASKTPPRARPAATPPSPPPTPSPPPSLRQRPLPSHVPAPVESPEGRPVLVLDEQLPPARSMFRGAIFSAACAAAGAGVWLAIAWYTGTELSLIAWAVGLASGVGMLLGRHRASRAAGAVSALLAAGGIIAGKILVFRYVAAPLLIVLAALTHQQLQQAGVDPARATPQQTREAGEKVRGVIRSMDAAARREQIRAVVAARRAEGTGGVLAGLDARQRIRLFARTMFGPMDLVLLPLAMGSAFKIATLGGAGGT